VLLCYASKLNEYTLLSKDKRHLKIKEERFVFFLGVFYLIALRL
jgi:hypothetical protein